MQVGVLLKKIFKHRKNIQYEEKLHKYKMNRKQEYKISLRSNREQEHRDTFSSAPTILQA